MLAVTNNTQYAAGVAVMPDKDGRDVLVVVVKATFEVAPGGRQTVAAEQVPVAYADEYTGEPGKSGLKAATDFALHKPATDVILTGDAVAPGGEPVQQMDVEVEVASSSRRVRVIGDRVWRKRLLGLAPSDPEPFTRMPLVWERAFGGAFPARVDQNPVGAGAWPSAAEAEGKPLPNLEDPHQQVRSWKDRPDPLCFGFVCGDWQPRVALTGTYDEAWQASRMPLLPEDFDYRFFNVAPEAGQLAERLVGGERVRVAGCTEDGEWAFDLPGDDITIRTLRPADIVVSDRPVLDTLILEPGNRRFVLVWRAKLATPVPITHLLHVEINSRANPKKSHPPAVAVKGARV